jgi:pyrimidine-nucleoside phosphorylase
VDKLESITGFSAALDADRFRAILRHHRLVLAAQSADLAPADGLLYALRDATATVQSLPLIASSVMSKKLAGGATHILLDVKVGRGAFMPTAADGRELARLMLDIGRQAGRHVEAVLSGMEQPLGQAVGNALEVAEAVATLQGLGPADLTDLCLHEAAALLVMAGAARDVAEAKRLARATIQSGAALDTLAGVVEAQGGDPGQVRAPQRLPRAPAIETIPATTTGAVSHLDALVIGQIAMRLGAGRRQKGDAIDHRIGLVLHAKVGSTVVADAPLVTVHAATPAAIDAVRHDLLTAYQWSDRPVTPPPLLLDHLA